VRPTSINAVHLNRIDPAKNMRRFYRLDVQPDLFGGILLMKEWGRIGAQGRMVAERYDAEAPATDALQRHAERKRRRGYADFSAAAISARVAMSVIGCNGETSRPSAR
jgi:predicted DNA-binding WGR domain protein